MRRALLACALTLAFALPARAQIAYYAPPVGGGSVTGSGSAVLANSPTITTPTITLSGSASQVLRGDGSIGAVPGAILTGTTSSIGGGALLAGVCASGTATVTGATTSMVASATPVTYPGDGAAPPYAYVSGSNTVTVKVCAIVALTPGASAYNVRVIP